MKFETQPQKKVEICGQTQAHANKMNLSGFSFCNDFHKLVCLSITIFK